MFTISYVQYFTLVFTIFAMYGIGYGWGYLRGREKEEETENEELIEIEYIDIFDDEDA